VLRLVYHTKVFGSLNFEFSCPLVRIGSARDNHLVLLHSSVAPYHCALAWEEESFALLPATADERTPLDDAPRYGPGDTLVVGEVTLTVERSPNSISVPPPKAEQIAPGRTHRGYWKAAYEAVPEAARWLCTNCQLRFEDRQIHAIGLEGKRKHILCPQCSRELGLLQRDTPQRHSLMRAVDFVWRKLRRWIGLAPRRRR
jgi:hypothetical protein